MTTPLSPDFIIVGIIWYVAFLFSTVCHEGAHALVAKWGGDLTAFHGGQVSLNPIPHIRRSLVGLVIVPILTYALNGWMMGWASAPYDPDWSRRYPRRAAWMAIAGPTTNFILMLLSGIGIHVGMAMGRFQAPASPSITHITELVGGGTNLATTFLSVMFMLNLILGTFNLLPIPPLDGNVGITVFMRESTAIRFTDWFRSFQFGFFGILLAWYAFGYIFRPVFLFAINLLYPGSHYQYHSG
jgi:Zn-dependent protease